MRSDVVFVLNFYAWLSFLESLLKATRADRPWRRHDIRQVILKQIRFTGIDALPLTVIAAAISGLLTVAQGASHLSRLGGGAETLSNLLIVILIRDVGPFLTLLIIISRSIAAVASELSTMRATGEIDSLRASGISPLSFIVMPRVLGGAVASFCLVVCFLFISMLVGVLGANAFLGLPLARMWGTILESVRFLDLVILSAKSIGVSIGIFLVACFYGLRIRGATFEIPQATSKAVVHSFIFVGIFECLSLGLYYTEFLRRLG